MSQTSLSHWVSINQCLETHRIESVDYFTKTVIKNDEAQQLFFSKSFLLLFAIDDIFDSNISYTDLYATYKYLTSKDERFISSINDIFLVENIMNIHFLIEELVSESKINPEFYRKILDKTLQGMLMEKSDIITKDKYLFYRKYSIGVPFVCALYFSFCKRHDFDENISYFEQGGEIIGLINDLWTFEREKSENKINLIKLLTTEGNSIPDAKNKINNMIQTKISALATSSEDNFYTEFLLNLAKKVEAFYQLYCFEHFAKNQNLT